MELVNLEYLSQMPQSAKIEAIKIKHKWWSGSIALESALEPSLPFYLVFWLQRMLPISNHKAILIEENVGEHILTPEIPNL